ncbi:hypothetical protein I3679_006000 [Proteus mirabilis]|uniref:Universal stress protein F n=1 Tax=Proteus mirabilis TaxID=584 RepID=A0ABD5LWB8_PROMI
MYKTILVPIDIDEDNLLNKAITLVENIAKREDPYVHFFVCFTKVATIFLLSLSDEWRST